MKKIAECIACHILSISPLRPIILCCTITSSNIAITDKCNFQIKMQSSDLHFMHLDDPLFAILRMNFHY